MTQKRSDPFQSIRGLSRVGAVVALLLVGITAGWAVMTDIAGAVIAPGKVKTDSNTKKVQHASGGIVGEILVRDGDRVTAGQVLVRLDATVAQTNRDIVSKRLVELLSRQARLVAERDGRDVVRFSTALTSRAKVPEIAAAIEGESRLFTSRRDARAGKKRQLRQRELQIVESIKGIEIQSQAKARETTLIERELAGARGLWKKGLMPISRLTALEREVTRVRGEHGQLLASIARARANIAETKLQFVQIDQDLASEVARELSEVNGSIAELRERKIAAEDQLRRIEVRAPQSGVVHHSIAHTVGGVVGAGETIMEIVPLDDDFVIEARVAPQDIDQLYINQPAMLRFSAFNQRTTPEVTGHVSLIAADTSIDKASGLNHYVVRLKVPDDQIKRLGDVKLVS